MAQRANKSKRRRPPSKKSCQMCRQHIEYLDYKDLSLIKPFLNERAKLKARRTTGACAKHQARLTEAVKNAREMALIPYTTR
ncbi:MAG: 30S ribosomal protein S18 [Nitriliruptorales bacterium]|nr:30S ribosomal protein S18 [Nitriliruptorales bacterium]